MFSVIRGILLLLALPFFASAQQAFVEGNIRYAVTLIPAGGNESPSAHTGTYTITVKGDRIRRALQMAAGFQSVILLDASNGTAYSLQTTPNHKYAIQLNAEEVAERARIFENFTLEGSGEESTIAEKACKPFNVRYQNGTTNALCLSTDWLPQNPNLNERFPGLKGIPLSFEYRSEDGALMRFTAEHIEAVPVEDEAFRVPLDYKVISQATLHRLDD